MPDKENKPVGQRFDLTYIEQGDPIDNSARMRRRLAAVFSDLQGKEDVAYWGHLERALGVFIPTYPMSSGVDPRKFFLKAELRDVLTSITIIWRETTSNNRKRDWLFDVKKIFREENTIYIIDEKAGVHPSPDAEYERNRVATIAVLASGRFEEALAHFEKVQEALNKQPPDLPQGIYYTFLAVEDVFKLMCPTDRLGKHQITKHLTPIIENHYSDDDIAKKAANEICEGFMDWANAAHNYRHAQGKEQPKQSSPELAIMIMSSGAAYLRWLAQIHQSRD